VLLYCLPYAALWIWLLIRFAGLEVEWRGGFPPALTFSKTKPDYDAVEADRRRRAAAAAVPIPAAGSGTGAAAYWSGFRGPGRDGHFQSAAFATNWPGEGLKPLWKQPCGGGYGSFAIAAGCAFTIEQRREEEVVAAYDLETGRELWTHAYAARFDEEMGGEGPRSTPTYDEGRLYAHGGTGEFRCLDAGTGKRVWGRNLATEEGAGVLYFGMSASPLVVDEVVIAVGSGQGGRSVLAFDKRTGERRWASLSEQMAYASPMVVSLAGTRQLLVMSASRVLGLAVADGALLWSHPWAVQYGNSIAQPVMIGTNRCVLSGGYGAGCVALEIEHGGAGFRARVLWQNKNLKNKFASSVFWDGHIYGLDEDILTCIDAATGRRLWKDGRYGYGQLLLARGHLVILAGDGHLALVRAVPGGWDEQRRFPALRGKTWNVPALGAGRLLVRNAVEMACFDVSGD
jgi:outer membrane protein assembly factor BamB